MKVEKKNTNPVNEQKIIDQIRSLGIDMIDEAKSGHPGIVLGAAPIVYSLYAHHLNFDAENPTLFNRDRFIMSAGHGSALLYATLYMAGFNIELEDLKKFRKIDSITPGHPEYKVTPGVDITTGPLGQGLASAVGIAMGERHLASTLNKNKNNLINFYTYVLCGDGDLMEGVSYEACSLAGTLKLNKLIVLYDSNHISLDGTTDFSFTENVPMRFQSMGWNVIEVNNGEDYTLINNAIKSAKSSTDKPTLIVVKTVIGKYSKYQGTAKVHGNPLEEEDILEIKKKIGVRTIPFAISSDTVEDFQFLIDERCKKLTSEFEEKMAVLDEEAKTELTYFMSEEKTITNKELEYTAPEEKAESPRDTSAKMLNSFAKNNSYLFGGSADLFSSCKNYINDSGDFSSVDYSGKNIYFGVREHAMGAILNGLALLGYRPYGSTMTSFSDYLKPSIRMACLMKLPIIYIFTHDSISVGEDGPTHQPMEQALSLRIMPNLEVFRPADANEVIGVYKTIMEKADSPAAMLLSKNKLPILETTKITEVSKGGYIVRESERKLDGIVIATGEEVHLAIEVANRLSVKGIDIRVVSMPSLERFLENSNEYKDEILPVEKRKIVIDTGSSYGWNKLIFNDKYIISMDQFGASGSKEDIYKKFGFDFETLEQEIENLLK